MSKIEFETVLVTAAKLPYVKIDREIFLRKELRGKYSPEVVELAVKHNPAYAGIPIDEIDKIANSIIKAETTKVTAFSAGSGLPGGFAIIATIPADLAQYFGHILRILQELIYLYGWKDLDLDADEMSEETKHLITIFIGVMFGVNGAVGTINKLSTQVAEQVVKKLPQKALTKGTIYPIVKKIAGILGTKLTKDVFAKGVAKVVPFLGAATSGGLTYITFKPMAKKLKKHLETGQLADVKFYQDIKKDDIIDGEIID